MGNMNYQDVLRDVHDPTNHALQISGSISAAGQATVTLMPSPSFIGIVTVANSQTNTGNVTLNPSSNFIGLTTTTIGNSMVTVTLGTKLDYVTDSIAVGNTPTVYIGTPTLFAVVNTGAAGVQNSMVTINPRTDYIGLMSVSGSVKNGGTSKTLVALPVAMSVGSIATIAVPTNANTMYITNLLLNSDATVRVNILSGVTYINGNASIGVTLNPGGGWVETGSPDSPTYIGCPSGSIVIQKFDMTATSAKVGGKLVYFQE